MIDKKNRTFHLPTIIIPNSFLENGGKRSNELRRKNKDKKAIVPHGERYCTDMCTVIGDLFLCVCVSHKEKDPEAAGICELGLMLWVSSHKKKPT